MINIQKILTNFCHKRLNNINDFSKIIAIASKKNILNADLTNTLYGAIQTSNLSIRDVMVPRSKMTTVNINSSFEELLSIITTTAHSRFPVVDNTNKIRGILLAKDLLGFAALKSDNFNYPDYIRQEIIVPENKSLDSLLKFFQLKKSHMMIVVDEYSEISGLITLEDVLEQIVGEIEDEHDLEEDDILDYGNNRFLVKPNVSIEDFNQYFSSKLSASGVDTIAGLINQRFGYIPQQLEEIKIEGFNFKILKSNARKTTLIEVKKYE